MWNFLKISLATLFGMLMFFILSIILLIVLASSGESPTAVKPQTVLKIRLDREIHERSQESFVDQVSGSLSGNKNPMGLLELITALEKAGSDPNISGIQLEMAGFTAGMASVEELRNALINFKKSGKFIYAYGEVYSEKSYYLASVADSMVLNPAGLLEFNGLSYRVLFYKGLLEKLGLEPEIYRVGTFKSAVEPFMLSSMSASNRAQISSYIESIYGYQISEIARSRNMDAVKLRNISDSMLVHSSQDARDLGLIDVLAYADGFDQIVKNKMKVKGEDKVHLVSIAHYESPEGKASIDASMSKIAIIVGVGDINSGSGDEESIGSDALGAEIRKAANDPDIKAIVLRINSPGGSVIASDVLWHEIIEAKKKKKVVASMSDLAASGGYYMAMGADYIVAQPNTLTGSIGVFGMLLNAKPFMEQKLGVTSDVVNTGHFSDVETPFRPRGSYEKLMIQKEVERTYDEFITKVSEDRKLEKALVQEVAQGRIWSGIQAKEKGLIDGLGGLYQAVDKAVELAKLDPTKIEWVYYPAKKEWFEKVIDGLDKDASALISAWNMQQNPETQYLRNWIKTLQNRQGVQARLPFEYLIED